MHEGDGQERQAGVLERNSRLAVLPSCPAKLDSDYSCAVDHRIIFSLMCSSRVPWTRRLNIACITSI